MYGLLLKDKDRLVGSRMTWLYRRRIKHQLRILQAQACRAKTELWSQEIVETIISTRGVEWLHAKLRGSSWVLVECKECGFHVARRKRVMEDPLAQLLVYEPGFPKF